MHSLLLLFIIKVPSYSTVDCTCQFAGLVEVDPDELAEPGAVVVPHSLCVTPGLQHRVGRHDLVLEGALALLVLGHGGRGDEGKVLNDLLGVLCLTSTRLTTFLTSKNRLVIFRLNYCF